MAEEDIYGRGSKFSYGVKCRSVGYLWVGVGRVLKCRISIFPCTTQLRVL